MVQTRSHTTRLPEHGMLVHYRSCEPKRKVKLWKAGETKRRRVTVVDTHDDPTYDANSNMPIDDAEPSQVKYMYKHIMLHDIVCVHMYVYISDALLFFGMKRLSC